MKNYSFQKSELTQDILSLFTLCVSDPTFECKVGYEVIDAALDGRINMNKPFNLRGYQSAILSNNKKSKARQNRLELSSDSCLDEDESTTFGDMLSDLDSQDEFELVDVDIDYDAAISYFAKYNTRIAAKYGVNVVETLANNLDRYYYAISSLQKLVEANCSIRMHVYALLEHGLDERFEALIGGDDDAES